MGGETLGLGKQGARGRGQCSTTDRRSVIFHAPLICSAMAMTVSCGAFRKRPIAAYRLPPAATSTSAGHLGRTNVAVVPATLSIVFCPYWERPWERSAPRADGDG